MRTAFSRSCHAAADRPGGSLSGGRSARHQKMHRRASTLLRRAAPPSNEKKTSTTTVSASSPPPSAAVVGQILPFRVSTATTRVSAPPNAPTILVLPGFGNDALDYLGGSPASSPPPPPSATEKESSPLSSLSSLLSSFFSSPSSPDTEEAGDEGAGGSSFDSDDDVLSAADADAAPPPPPPPPRPPSLAAALESRGFSVAVVPVKRSDWLRVARCAVDPAYWRGEADPETAYGWYLDLAERAVEEAALANSSDSGVVLLGHSAGGWLGRALIGRGEVKAKSTAVLRSRVRALCTLGTPHAHNETARCVTGGALARVNELWPGAFFSTDDNFGDEGEEDDAGKVKNAKTKIRYVAVAGRAVVGDALAPRGTAARAAAAAYSQVAGGDGHGVAGDGVVPLSAATLPGADNVVLDGVFHAPRGGRRRSSGGEEEEEAGGEGEEGAAAQLPRWFGDEAVVDSWLSALVKALED